MKTTFSGDDFDRRKILMLLGLAGANVVGWKLVNQESSPAHAAGVIRYQVRPVDRAWRVPSH